MRLRNRKAVVTGGSSGIGRGICLELASEGAKVIVADIQEDPKVGKFHETGPQMPTVAVIEEAGGNAFFVKTDVAEERDIATLVEQAATRFGGIDIFVNNAGITIPGNSQELPTECWDRIIGVNLRSIFLTTKYSVPHLKRSAAGRTINISSVHLKIKIVLYIMMGLIAFTPGEAMLTFLELILMSLVRVVQVLYIKSAVCPKKIEIIYDTSKLI